MFDKIYLLALLVFVSLFISCGESETEKSKEPQIVEVQLTANDQMKFNLKSIVAKEGDIVKIHFKNVGKMPKKTMGHNFVLLKPEVDIASFATKAISADYNDYIPEELKNDIIAHSHLLGPGESTIIEFKAPSKGVYKFICSFPGHYLSMQGNLIVR